MMKQQVFGDGISANQINTGQGSSENQEMPKRPTGNAMARGILGKCPCCGEGKLFSGWLTVADDCTNCKEELKHHRADDLPAYLNIFLVGHVVVGMMLFVQTLKIFEMWTLVAMTATLALATAIGGLRPVKGAVVGFQWAQYMHGFGGDES